jgi:hypothetical protein
MENGLADEIGHHFNNSVGIRQAFTQNGLDTRFFVHRDAKRVVLEALQARAVFRFKPYQFASQIPLAGPIGSLFIKGKAFAKGFDTAVAEGLEPQDLVFVPTATQQEIYGCAIGISRLPPERRPRLILNFIIENFLVAGKLEINWHAYLYRFAIRHLGRVTRSERVLLTTNGKRMAEWLGKVLARPVMEYPMPKHYPPGAMDVSVPAASKGPPCVAILGHSLPKKGFHLVPELVARNPQLQWLVQVSPAGQDKLWHKARAAMHAAQNVQLVIGSLDPAAYYELISRADLILMPYDAAQLPLRSSGIFSEAVAASKVVVVPQGTWMSDQLAAGHGSGAVFDSQTPESISDALHQALARLPELSLYARTLAPAWRSQQSIFAYVDRALGVLTAYLPEPARPESESEV